MKLFKLLKSCTVGFLALALIVGVMGVTKVSAADGSTVTFETTDGYKYVYSYTTDGGNQEVNIADILKNLKKDGTAVADKIIKSFKLGEGEATNVTGGSLKYKLPASVSGKSITVTLAPAKLKTVFTCTFDSKEYKYEVELENGKENSVTVNEIAAGLQKDNKLAEAELGYELAVTAATDYEITGGAIKVDYSAIADAAATIQVTAEKAFTSIVYDPVNDVIKVTAADPNATVAYIDVKSTDGANVTGKNFKTVNPVGDTCTIVLNDSRKSYKVAENKDLFLYITLRKPADKEKLEDQKPNFIVYGTKYKSIAVTPNYAKAYPGETGCVVDVANIVLKDNENNAVTSDKLNLSKLLFSTDNKTWYPVNSSDYIVSLKKEGTTASGAAIEDAVIDELEEGLKVGDNVFTYKEEEEWAPKLPKGVNPGSELKDGDKITITIKSASLSGENLYALCSLGKKDKTKLYFKYEGGIEADGKIYRSSKAKNYSIPKIKELKSVKIDFVKATVAIKHGFDYYVASAKLAAKEMPAYAAWKTVLPYKKDDKANTATTVATNTFVPQAKFNADTNASGYTKTKVSGLVLADICAEAWTTSGEAFVYARKSATTKAPASAYVLAAGGTKAGAIDKVAKPATAPAIAVVTDKTYYATEPATGKAFTIPTITKATGDVDRTFEYTIVKKADWDDGKVKATNLKWSKLAKDKTIKFTAKFSYTVPGDTAKTDAILYTEDKLECYILVRSAAVKEKALASEILVTEVVKDGANLSWKPVIE